jgi:hypothetical protein
MKRGNQKEAIQRQINTSFVELLNLSICQCGSQLTRRTWGTAKFTPELMEHLEWFRIILSCQGVPGILSVQGTNPLSIVLANQRLAHLPR